MITVRNVPKIALNTASDGIDNRLWYLAMDVRKLVKDRTLSGVDYNHQTFEPYSEGYKKYRAKKGKATSKVIMQFTGKMLQAMSLVKINPKLIRIFINDQNRAYIGSIHQRGEGSQPERAWFGINQADADKLYRQRFWNCRGGVFVK